MSKVQADAQASPSPLAREAVKEFYGRCTDATDFFRENIGPVPAGRAAKIVTAESLNVLLDAVSRIEARVRAEVWGKAHDAIEEAVKDANDKSESYGDASPTISREWWKTANVFEHAKDAIAKAALADGVDLTGLAKME